jgi:hypothetical protein
MSTNWPLVENGRITGDRICGKISIYTHQQSGVDCNEQSIIFLFRLVVFIHFDVNDDVCVFVADTKNEMNDTAGGNNRVLISKQYIVYTKNETNRSKQSKRSGGAGCGSAN